MGRGLAYSRHSQQKAKDKAKKKLKSWRFKATPKTIGMHAKTPKRCSCWMCGNQRKNHGPKISELKWM